MIAGAPLSSIGLLRQAELELTARNAALRRGAPADAPVTVDIAQPVERLRAGAGIEAAAEPARRRILDITV
ncbi:hypothetical protein J2X36_005000 [Methylobacterium sp. BE186]|uniref:hypothetical protein n=1 Tax=Methylobacterium sp. BE186 TaxID=2817715 RepID=UPI002857F9EB|nr:hypothetical protein [Methylobacterium sp. BE186]MDR7040219.1 hypothetical protein [Methylobacterium sp. BE186]